MVKVVNMCKIIDCDMYLRTDKVYSTKTNTLVICEDSI